ncbi:ABC transporter substrate-binding protein, partial [Prescottella equi]|uniref:ABC transporter substrate-binding protein n=1 Tax=Rhodococcus hoagii TaxID=43767 RepID=UPI000A8807C0
GKIFLTPVFDRLVMEDVGDALVPGLATEWKFSEDGAFLDLTLREGVTFHDGSVFDAETVAANIRRGQTLPGSTVAAALKPIVGVEVVDPAHVRLALAPGAGVELPSVFATNAGMMISSKAIASGADIGQGPGDAGSGPYLVSSYTPQESVVLSRAEGDYWDPEAGRVAGIEFKAISDATTRLNGVRTGATDLTWVSSASEIVDAKQLAAQGTLNVEEVKFRNVLGVMMRPRGDLAKPEVRQAVARAIDPEAISALFSGTCTPNRQFYPAGSWPADPDYQYPYTYDEAAAKELVSKAGSANVSLTFGSG